MANLRPTGHLIPRDDGARLELERTFEAPIASIWAAVTESDRLGDYIGTWTGDPRSGTVEFQLISEGEQPPATYHILDCEPPAHLVVQLGEPDVEEAPWTVELALVEVDGVTTLALRQQVDDLENVGQIAAGWEYYLDRLVASLKGEDAQDVFFEPYSELVERYQAMAD